MANPLSASLKVVNSVYRVLSRSFPHILVADDVWTAYLMAGVNESLDSFQSGGGGSPGSGSTEQYRLHGVKDPNFSAGAED